MCKVKVNIARQEVKEYVTNHPKACLIIHSLQTLIASRQLIIHLALALILSLPVIMDLPYMIIHPAAVLMER